MKQKNRIALICTIFLKSHGSLTSADPDLIFSVMFFSYFSFFGS